MTADLAAEVSEAVAFAAATAAVRFAEARRFAASS
jgi:hypothetical protein